MTIKDVANYTGYSVATVSKALSKKGSISLKTRRLIYDAALEMGYKVNSVAQSLSRHGVVFGIVKPRAWPPFYGQIYNGILRELASLSDFNVTSMTVEYDEEITQEDLLGIFVDMVKKQVDAIVICTGIRHNYAQVIQFLKEREIPFAEAGNSLLSGSSNVCVRVDANCSGRLAGEYMRNMVRENAKVAVLIANQATPDHVQKVNGFFQEYHQDGQGLQRVYETMDIPKNTYRITAELIRNEPDLQGIYVATVSSSAVCQCIADSGLRRPPKLIVTDIQPQLKEYINNGVVSATIFQNTTMQGRLTVRLLYNCVIRHKPTKKEVLVTPQLVLRANYPNYLVSESQNGADLLL